MEATPPTTKRVLVPTNEEPLAVGIHVATAVLEGTTTNKNTVYMDGPRVPATKDESSASVVVAADDATDQQQQEQLVQTVCRILHPVCVLHLEHAEPRVRTLVAKAVGAWSGAVAVQNNEAALPSLALQLQTNIHDHLVRGRDEASSSTAEQQEQQTADQYSRTSTGALDDTTGWRALETHWLCYAALLGGLGRERYRTVLAHHRNENVEQFLQDTKESCVDHINRHVRAAAMQCLEQWIVVSANENDPAALAPLRDTVVAVLRQGLADNWSQVRMAASVLCRVWLQHYTTFRDDTAMLSILIPRMCLNRFYLAAGVKLYSHDTWRQVFADGSGLTCLHETIRAVVRYYVKMCDADNHAVREAACQAIAELGSRVSPLDEDIVETLLQALLMCFHDESWPVRDEACVACGSLCKAYPDACRGELKTLWERWTEQLTDQIWSVRAGAAVALGDALQAFPGELTDKVRALITKLLPAARDQPAMTAAEYKEHVNNTENHTDTQLYSCGSLAPKLRKGGAGRIGCSSCGINRPKAPWEATDGCLYLIREIVVLGASQENSIMAISDDELMPLWEQMMDVCRVQHFPQSHELRATLWKLVPPMAQALGKVRFKRQYLSSTAELLFWNLDMSTASALSKHAASECVEQLTQLIGRAMFRGRLDDWQQDVFDRVLSNRQKTMATPEIVSPFGPPGMIQH